MAETIGQHLVAAFSSPINGTSPIDANTVRGNDNTMRTGYNEHDSDPGIHFQSSLLASRPGASAVGRKWLTADTGSYRLFYDDGSTWRELSYLSSAGGAVTGNLTVSGTLGVTGVLTATGGVVGNASTATALATGRTISATGDLTYTSPAFDGTADITAAATLATVNATPGAFGVTGTANTTPSVVPLLTVNAKGLVTFAGAGTVVAGAGALSGATLASNVLASSLTSVGTLSTLAVSGNTKIGNGAASNTGRLMVNTLSGTAAGIQLLQDGSESWTMESAASSTSLRWLASVTELMRLSNAGNLMLGTTTESARLSVEVAGAALYARRTNAGVLGVFRNGDDAGYGFAFQNAAGTDAGSIYWTATTTTFATSSDVRLKQHIAEADDAGALLDALQVRQFDWIQTGAHQRYGMVAQEVLLVAPEAVTVSQDVNGMMGVDFSKLVPMLVKEVQSLRGRVAVLES